MATKAAKNDKSNEQRYEAHVEEFIPFACHYDDHTLLTKNGELLQTIKITGFSFESVHNQRGETVSLRRTIRSAITESIESNGFAVWIHTLRRKRDLSTKGEYKEEFAKYVNEVWCERHDWEHKYVNELYVTIIHEGQAFDMSPQSIMRSLSLRGERKYREKYLKKAHATLEATVQKILTRLNAYGARHLGVVENAGVLYSEPIQFLGKIINLKEEPMPMPISDISEYLPTHTVSFGFNALEVTGETGTHFGALLSVKEYHEVTSTSIDEFLQLDQQFIITEAFDFINNALALKKFEHQEYMLKLSGDRSFAQISGLDDVLKSNRGKPVDYGEHQITVMLLEDDLPKLEQEMTRMLEAFHRIGVVAVREDVVMEDCFWSQLPANFDFLRRLTPINSMRIGGFASLYNFPAGKIDGSHWGPALTVFYTKAGTPYFFNFHEEDNGHTAIIGPFGAGKTVLLNFLTSEARKYNNKLFFFDQHRASELFIRAIGGSYKRILRDERSTQLRFNPLLLPDTSENRVFLSSWLQYLIMDDQYNVAAEDKERIEQALNFVFSAPNEERRLSVIGPKFWPVAEKTVAKLKDEQVPEQETSTETSSGGDIDALLSQAAGQEKSFSASASIEDIFTPQEEEQGLPSTPEERLALWYGEGKYAHIFDNDVDELAWEGLVYGFGVTEMIEEKYPLVPVLTYLFHRIKEALDGAPAMLVLDEAWSLVDNPVFAPHISAWLDDLRARNTIVIFATESVEDAEKSSITKDIIDKLATKIFLPNPEATKAYKKVFGLTEHEFDLLTSMDGAYREFLLHHHDEAVVARLDLKGLYDIIAVLSGQRENIALAESIMLEVGDDPKDWLPQFQEQMRKSVTKE